MKRKAPHSFFSHGKQVTTGRTFVSQQRKKRLIELIREDPSRNNRELAKELGVTAQTIGRYLAEITEQLKCRNLETWELHRQRVLDEIEEKKSLCNKRLHSLRNSAHQGSRWLEEWSKLTSLQVKILGLATPEKLILEKGESFSKEQQDSVLRSVMKAAEIESQNAEFKVIETKQIPENTSEAKNA